MQKPGLPNKLIQWNQQTKSDANHVKTQKLNNSCKTLLTLYT